MLQVITWNNSITNGVAFSPGSTTTYTVTGTDGNGCQNTNADQLITVSTTTATVNAGADIVVNLGDALSIDATVSNEGSSSTLLTENFSSGAIAEGNSSTYISQSASNASQHSAPYGVMGIGSNQPLVD